jgi:hypothetical protein
MVVCVGIGGKVIASTVTASGKCMLLREDEDYLEP